jgi:uncharacterized protein
VSTGPAQPRNPFVFDRPLESAQALVGRERELADLQVAVIGDGALVEGPHRHGKTSLVNAALAQFAADEHGLAARVDCEGVLTVSDAVRRLEDAYARAWADGAVEQALVERLEGLSLRLAVEGSATPAARLDQLLRIPGEVAEQAGCRAALCFDEVGDALAVPDLRAAIERSRNPDEPRVGVVFVGPNLSALEWSADARTVTVETIDPDLFVAELERRFAETGRDAGEAATALMAAGAGHPQRTSLLAAQLWELTPEGTRATLPTAREAIERALALSAPELEMRWQSLHSNERRVAVAIAQDLAPQGTRAQRVTGLAGYGAAQRALQGLKNSGAAKTDEQGTTLTDPLFAEWLRRRYQRAAPEPNWQALRRQRAELQRGITRRM